MKQNSDEDQVFGEGSIQFVQEQCWLVAIPSLKTSPLLPLSISGLSVLVLGIFILLLCRDFNTCAKKQAPLAEFPPDTSIAVSA